MSTPEPRITIQFQGEERELYMSYLRLNSCLRIVGDPENVATMLLDPDTSEMIVSSLLADKASAFYELGEDDISTEDYDRILLWAQEHLHDFLLRRFGQMGKTSQELEPKAQALVSSQLGSIASSLKEPSAGHSTQSPAT